MLTQILIATSAAIVLLLGSLHLIFTFATQKFMPRDSALADQMKRIAPVISRQTTMWRAWIGFNASHSLGAMLFGAIYAYLAYEHVDFLLQSRFLLLLGILFLASLLVLARRYWFHIPQLGIAVSLLLYVLGIFSASRVTG